MSTSTSHPVIVGVDGSDVSNKAIAFGVAEAARLGRDVTLVHVVPDFVAVSPMAPLMPQDLRETGEEILQGALEEARRIDPDVAVTTELRWGHRVATLADGSGESAVVVVGHEHRSLVDRILTGATASGLAARAVCPVVAVPTSWAPEAVHGSVVVGVKAPAHSSELLARAFAAAAARHAELVVVHAWEMPSGYDDIIASRVAQEEWVQHATSEIEPLLAPWRKAYPDVVVRLRIVHDQPAHALVAASTAADLLVVVRRAHGFPAMHLGACARAVLRESRCPVEVVAPEPVAAEVPDLVLETSGVPQK